MDVFNLKKEIFKIQSEFILELHTDVLVKSIILSIRIVSILILG